MRQRLICLKFLKILKDKKIIITRHSVPIAISSLYDDRNKYASFETIKRLNDSEKIKSCKDWPWKSWLKLAGIDEVWNCNR